MAFIAFIIPKGEEKGIGRKETKHKDVLNIRSENQEKDP